MGQRANNQEHISQKLKEKLSKGWCSVRILVEAAKWLSDSLKEKRQWIQKDFYRDGSLGLRKVLGVEK